MKNTVFWDVAPCRFCVNWRFGGKHHLHLQGRKIRERGISVGRFFYAKDGGDTFLRNVGSRKIYKAPHPRRRYSTNKDFSFLWSINCVIWIHILWTQSQITQEEGLCDTAMQKHACCRTVCMCVRCSEYHFCTYSERYYFILSAESLLLAAEIITTLGEVKKVSGLPIRAFHVVIRK
jgi:hypothetical protein